MTVLRTGKFLKGKTPVAFEPSSHPASQQALCDRLQRASDAFEQTSREKAGGGVDVFEHPYFGCFGIGEFVRLQASHTRHHRLQIIGVDR